MKADVIMAGTSKRKNLAYKKPKCGVVLARVDQNPKPPPPFRFGKLSYNEDKLLSRDIRSTKSEDRNGALTIIGRRPNLRITAKLSTLSESKVQRNGHCGKDQREICLNSRTPDTKTSTVDNHIPEIKCCHSDGVTTRQNGAINVLERIGDWRSTSKSIANPKETDCRQYSSKPSPFCMLQTATNGVRSYQHSILAGDFLKESKEKAKRTASRGAMQERNCRIGVTRKSEGCNDGRKEDTLAKENQQTRANGKDRRAVALVKQKSKRIPTRNIKYVSELGEELRNKYRRKKNVSDMKKEKKAVVEYQKSDEIEYGFVDRKSTESQLIKGAENLSRHGEVPLAVEKQNDRPVKLLMQKPSNGVINREEVSCTIQAKNGRVKSAPVAKSAGKHVESFLVRNGLIPKASSKPGKTKNEGSLARKRSVKLKLSRSRAKSLRKRNVVHCVSKASGKEVLPSKVANGFSHEDTRLNNCWKVRTSDLCNFFSNMI